MTPGETAQVRRAGSAGRRQRARSGLASAVLRRSRDLLRRPTLRRLARSCARSTLTIVLTHSPQDYMEDHMITARLAVTATFARGDARFATSPRASGADNRHDLSRDAARLRDGLRRRVIPEHSSNTTRVHERKTCSARVPSQPARLAGRDARHGQLYRDDGRVRRSLGSLSRRFRYAEGWRRHLHYGFGGEKDDPLKDALGNSYRLNAPMHAHLWMILRMRPRARSRRTGGTTRRSIAT